MKSVKLEYFALLKDEAGTDKETYQTRAKTLLELYLELKEKYSFSLCPELINVAVNDNYVSLSDVVADDAKIVFIPPVAGG